MRKVILSIVLIMTPIVLRAQDVSITVEAPGTAVAGERFTIVYSVNSTDGKFTPPEFDPSFSVAGPQTSSSRNVQWINGEVTSVETTRLIYFVVASKTGSFTIPSAKYVTKKATILSDPVQIEVTGEAARQDPQSSDNRQAGDVGGDISLKLILDRTDVYVGQPVSATLKIFTRVNLSGLNDLKYPEIKGFLREDINTPPLTSLQSEVIGGVQYGTGVIQKFVLFPQISGDLTIDPIRLTALVQQRTKANDPFNDPFFSDFFNSVTNVPQELSTGSKTIHVKPLPIPQPSDFYGAVGSFEISSSLDKNTVEINDALTYTVVLKGSGNLSLSGAPVISFPQGIEKYDPKVSVKASGPGSGSKTFEYLLIPRNKGTFEIPPLSYTVFDIKQEKYVTLRTPGYTVSVTGSASGTEAAPVSVDAPGEDVKYLGQDIRFIHNAESRLDVHKEAMIKTTAYWMWFLLAVAVAVAALLLRREYIRRSSDITGVRNRKAAGMARKRLSRANAHLSGNRPELVNEEIAKAVWGYLGDKLAIPLADLTRENCYNALRSRNVSEDLISEMDRILAACEYSRYSRAAEGESPDMLYRRTVELISRLESVL